MDSIQSVLKLNVKTSISLDASDTTSNMDNGFEKDTTEEKTILERAGAAAAA